MIDAYGINVSWTQERSFGFDISACHVSGYAALLDALYKIRAGTEGVPEQGVRIVCFICL